MQPRAVLLLLGLLQACGLAWSEAAAAEPRAGRVQPADPPQTRDHRAGRGKGVFIKITFGGTRIRADALEQVKDNPYVAGVQALVTWSQLEPRKGEYRWEVIDDLLEQCGAAGKQVAFVFAAASGKVPTRGQRRKGKGRAGPDATRKNTATPGWLFDDPKVRKLGGFDTPQGPVPVYPVFWDPAYQKHLEDFIAAWGRRYDGDPRIEFIRMGGWQVHTNEPSFYGGASMLLRDQLAKEGESFAGRRKPRLSAKSRYAGAVIHLIDVWHKHFKRTRLAATIHASDRAGSFEEAMNAHCARKGCTVLNSGLNEADHRRMRKYYRTLHDEYDCKVGWGGITHLGQKSSSARSKARPHSLLGEAFRQGLGADGDPRYAPASRASYVVCGPNALGKTDALKWVSEHLVE